MADAHNIWVFIILIAGVILPAMTVVTTYALAETERGHLSSAMTFISATFNYPPESCIGGFGMSITGTLFVLISLFRYRFVARLIEAAKVFNDLERFHRANKWSLALGLIMSISLHGIGAFQFVNQKETHLTFAFLFFASGLANVYVMLFLDHKLEIYSPSLRSWSVFIATLAGLSSVAGLVCFIVLQVQGVREGAWHWIAALCELISVSCFLGYYTSYMNEFRQVALEMYVYKGEVRLSNVDPH